SLPSILKPTLQISRRATPEPSLRPAPPTSALAHHPNPLLHRSSRRRYRRPSSLLPTPSHPPLTARRTEASAVAQVTPVPPFLHKSQRGLAVSSSSPLARPDQGGARGAVASGDGAAVRASPCPNLNRAGRGRSGVKAAEPVREAVGSPMEVEHARVGFGWHCLDAVCGIMAAVGAEANWKRSKRKNA
ncbi:unnamed protein product, partial [Urochloa humidicola]